MERYQERISTARKALQTLLEVIGQDRVPVILRDAAIQRFEYTFEAVWKAARGYLIEMEGIEAASASVVSGRKSVVSGRGKTVASGLWSVVA